MENRTNWKIFREIMVERQIRSRGISDPAVLSAFLKVPRHLFVPEKMLAYDDSALPIGAGQTISQPYMVALMTSLLELKKSDKVLEIGTGSGYQAAILAELSKEVISIERVRPLADHAEAVLKSLDYTNISIYVGDGTEGFPEKAPYDAIIVTAGCPEIPKPLLSQLKDGGRLVIPIGDRFSQILFHYKRSNDKLNNHEKRIFSLEQRLATP